MGKHSRKYLDELHHRERRRTIIWAVVIVAVLAVGIGVIVASALSAGQGSNARDTAQSSARPAAELQDSSAAASFETASDAEDSSAGSASDRDQATSKESADDAEENAGAENLSLAGFTICIDPGHCAHPDSTPSPNNPDASVSQDIATEPGGTSGRVSGPEYKICMLVAKQLKKDYEAAGAQVVMVRSSDDVNPISPKNRALIANRAGADAFVRLHCDSAGSSAHGFYTLVPAKTGYQAKGGLYKKSQQMGRFMHKRIVKELGANDRGVTVRSDQGGFNWCKEPCVLFEMANMANASDDKKLAKASYQAKLARAICNATVAWFER